MANLVFDSNELHTRCDEVNPIDAKQTCIDIEAKLKKYDLPCLSAPQIGIKERVVGINFDSKSPDKYDIRFYINPIVLKAEDYHLCREKDVTFPDKEFIVPRPTKLLVRYQKENAAPAENYFYKDVAEIFDRMMNYLDGVTLDEIGLEVIPEFDEATEEEKQEVINMYLNSLKNRAKILQDNIDQDKDAKKLQEALKFIKAVDEGKVELEPLSNKENKDNDK